VSWAERVAERAPIVQRSRARGVEQATAIVEAAQRRSAVKGSSFTTQELVKEAGVAQQTFYRYFGGKDQLILAVIEHMVTESAASFRLEAAHLDDPVARLRFHVTSVLRLLDESEDLERARFFATEHWRLQSVHPAEIAAASRSYTDLLEEEIKAGTVAGLLRPVDVTYAAWLVTQLVRAVFHYYAFVEAEQSHEEIREWLWAFCLGGLGGDLRS
jgi:TetR/AcrR family transcriptional regulator